MTGERREVSGLELAHVVGAVADYCGDAEVEASAREMLGEFAKAKFMGLPGVDAHSFKRWAESARGQLPPGRVRRLLSVALRVATEFIGIDRDLSERRGSPKAVRLRFLRAQREAMMLTRDHVMRNFYRDQNMKIVWKQTNGR